jgi:predicted nuclease with TOPRIM domain
VQLQDKEQLVSSYVTENNNLASALSDAETRLNELYAEQSRWESELAQRIDISEKLREQVRELEKEKRDIQRRYNEQVRFPKITSA